MSGNLIMEGNYSNGARNGEFTFYFKNGLIDCKGEYSENNRIGNWKYYYSNGNLKQIIFFSNGRANMNFAVIEYFDREGNQLVKTGPESGLMILSEQVCSTIQALKG